MQNLNHFHRLVILGSAALGSGYGFFTTMSDKEGSALGIVVSMVAAAALCACAASALCRYVAVWQELHQSCRANPTIRIGHLEGVQRSSRNHQGTVL